MVRYDSLSRVAVKIAILGDSVAAGLGARGRQFPVLVAEDLGAELVDLSTSARMIGDDDAEAVRGADIVVIAHGVTEAVLRPTTQALRCVPPRWRRAGWLDPRPFFGKRGPRRYGQRIESGCRWRVKVVLMRLFGHQQWMGSEQFAMALRTAVDGCGPDRVILVGGFTIDDRFFPGSAAELERYAVVVRDVAAASGARHVDLTGACRRWDDYLADHFHPSQSGHRKIADLVTPAVRETAASLGAEASRSAR